MDRTKGGMKQRRADDTSAASEPGNAEAGIVAEHRAPCNDANVNTRLAAERFHE